MKKNALMIPVFGLMLLAFACNTKPAGEVNKKLEGKWQSKDGNTKLEITDKGFTMDDGKPVTEDYFVKKDTIFTSYEGSRPFTKFLIKNLDDHKLILFYPDSDIVEFSR
jgi:lipopolysaccharide export LptBFGC system permease protein LptF